MMSPTTCALPLTQVRPAQPEGAATGLKHSAGACCRRPHTLQLLGGCSQAGSAAGVDLLRAVLPQVCVLATGSRSGRRTASPPCSTGRTCCSVLSPSSVPLTSRPPSCPCASPTQRTTRCVVQTLGPSALGALGKRKQRRLRGNASAPAMAASLLCQRESAREKERTPRALCGPASSMSLSEAVLSLHCAGLHGLLHG